MLKEKNITPFIQSYRDLRQKADLLSAKQGFTGVTANLGIPEMFLIKWINAFVSDNQGSDVQYRIEILSDFDGSTLLHFLPTPTVLADASTKG